MVNGGTRKLKRKVTIAKGQDPNDTIQGRYSVNATLLNHATSPPCQQQNPRKIQESK